MALEKLEIETYKLERGEYYVNIAGQGPDFESWHRIFLQSKPNAEGVQKHVELQFASDRYLENYYSTGVGKVYDSENRVLIRYRLSEFEHTYDMLRSEKPVFFEYDRHWEDRVHTARLTTSREETGEGPTDLTHP